MIIDASLLAFAAAFECDFFALLLLYLRMIDKAYSYKLLFPLAAAVQVVLGCSCCCMDG